MSRSSTFHKTSRNDHKKNHVKNNTINNQNSLGNVLKESFTIGVGVSTANEIINRISTSLFGSRTVEIINKNNINCDKTFENYKKCLENKESECKIELENYEKCIKGV